MFKKKWTLFLCCALIVVTVGCSSTPIKWKCEAGTSGGDAKVKCSVEGTFKQYKKNGFPESINNVSKLSYNDFKKIDFSVVSIKLDGVNGAAIQSKEVTLNLYDEKILVSSQKFQLVKTHGVFKLRFPSKAKDWAGNYYNVIDKVTFEFDTTQSESGTILISTLENGVTRASTSIFIDGGIDNNISWDEK